MTTEISAPLLSRIEAAKYLGLAPQTLAVWAGTGRYKLPYVRCGSRAMYRLEDLERFIESRRITHAPATHAKPEAADAHS